MISFLKELPARWGGKPKRGPGGSYGSRIQSEEVVKGRRNFKKSPEADRLLSKEVRKVLFPDPPLCTECPGAGLELGGQLCEMPLCPALATELLIYSCVTPVYMRPSRVRELRLGEGCVNKKSQISVVMQRCVLGQFVGGRSRRDREGAGKMQRVER